MRSAKFYGLLTVLILSMALGCVAATGEEVSANLSQTTGLPTGKPYRPVLVEISNSPEARPSWGLSKADIVYELIYWAPHHTRYVAVFNDEHPDKVGSIRGARIYDFDLREAWDGVMVHHGGQDIKGSSIYDYMKGRALPAGFSFDGVKGGKHFTRDEGRISPHNMVNDLAALVRNDWPADPDTGEPYAPRASGLQFSAYVFPGSRTAYDISLDYGHDYQPAYHFDDSLGGYIRFYNGLPQHDDGSQEMVVVQNIIVQSHEEYFVYDAASRPMVVLTGGGKIRAYINGTVIDGYWERATPEDPIQYFDTEMTPLTLLPGKTFVQIVPPQMFRSQTTLPDGSEHYTNAAWYNAAPSITD